MNRELNINQLSSHLFWDADLNKFDFDKNKKWLIKRVLEYGLFEYWQNIINYYGINDIAEVSMQFKDMDNKTLSLISALSSIPKENFLCYTSKQLRPKHWDF